MRGMNGKQKKRRVNVTLDAAVFEKLRDEGYRRDKPWNYLIERALQAYLPRRAKEQRA